MSLSGGGIFVLELLHGLCAEVSAQLVSIVVIHTLGISSSFKSGYFAIQRIIGALLAFGDLHKTLGMSRIVCISNVCLNRGFQGQISPGCFCVVNLGLPVGHCNTCVCAGLACHIVL